MSIIKSYLYTHILTASIHKQGRRLGTRPRRAGLVLCDHADMRSRVQAIVLPSETLGEFVDEVRRIFADLGRGTASTLWRAECTPNRRLRDRLDGGDFRRPPGVDRASLRIVVRGTAVLVAGDKAPRRGRGDSSFHLVERGFGRFARIVRLGSMRRGERRPRKGRAAINLPKVAERRGRAIFIEVKKPRRADPFHRRYCQQTRARADPARGRTACRTPSDRSCGGQCGKRRRRIGDHARSATRSWRGAST